MNAAIQDGHLAVRTPATSPGLLTSNGQHFPLQHELTIGRSDDATVQLNDPAISRDHAVIRQHEGRWWILDCGSRNGTRVNQTDLPALTEHPLRNGDVVVVGGQALRITLPIHLDETSTLNLDEIRDLSPYQLQVVQALATPWLHGKEPASNAEIAASLGTPRAIEAVKAALRRCYSKAGISQLATNTKRRELCRIAATNGWIAVEPPPEA